MSNPTLKKITKEWLIANGYDGLYNDCGDCGCEVDDLMPCSEWMNQNCTAGYKVEYKTGEECPCGEGCPWHIQANKAEVKNDSDC